MYLQEMIMLELKVAAGFRQFGNPNVILLISPLLMLTLNRTI